MPPRLRKGYAAIAIVLVAATLVIVSMTAPVVSTTTDFSIYNTGWNGTSKLAILTYQVGKFVPTFRISTNGADVTIANTGLEQLTLDPASSSLIIIGPTKAFSQTDGAVVGNFVRAGGVLFLADDFGKGNSLLERMGATSRFSGSLVIDLAYEKRPEFSVCFDIRPSALTNNVSTMLLNYPSSLEINATTTQAFAYTSVASWLDTNGDLYQELGEPKGPFPILAIESLGSGRVVLLSDPSVLINGMNKYMNNSILARNLIDFVSAGRSQVFFDESHRDFFDPVTITTTITGHVSPNVKVIIVTVAFAVTLWISSDMVDRALSWTFRRMKAIGVRLVQLLGLRRKEERAAPEPADTEQLVSELATKHPEWRIGLLRYLVRESRRHGEATKEKSLGQH